MAIPHLDEYAIRRHVGAGAYQRGVEYARLGMVVDVRWDADARILRSSVRGSGPTGYDCSITVDLSGRIPRILSSRCTCPMRSACKHVVATALSGGEEPASPTPAPPPPWQRLLAASAAPPPVTTALALGIELRVYEENTNQWAPRRTVAVTPRELMRETPEVRLAIRPLSASSRTGAWIRSGIAWDDFRRPAPHLPAVAHRWFRELLALSRDSLLSGTAGEWILVDHVDSDLFLSHLRRASALGIPLIAVQD
ncbi:MAG: SWIM zinc finger family protein, partial [Microbacterium sp.]